MPLLHGSYFCEMWSQGAANRKVAATNMNRASSRSHSVFTCVIESKVGADRTLSLFLKNLRTFVSKVILWLS